MSNLIFISVLHVVNEITGYCNPQMFLAQTLNQAGNPAHVMNFTVGNQCIQFYPYVYIYLYTHIYTTLRRIATYIFMR